MRIHITFLLFTQILRKHKATANILVQQHTKPSAVSPNEYKGTRAKTP